MVFQIEIRTFQHLCVDLEKIKLVHNFKLYLVNRKFEQYIMVNNSTNINKTYNHLSPQIIERKKGPLHTTLEILAFLFYLNYSYDMNYLHLLT